MWQSKDGRKIEKESEQDKRVINIRLKGPHI